MAHTMEENGVPLTRIEEKEDGAHFFYNDPKKKKECGFWVVRSGDEEFWCCGLSSSSAKIVDAFEKADLFEKK